MTKLSAKELQRIGQGYSDLEDEALAFMLKRCDEENLPPSGIVATILYMFRTAQVKVAEDAVNSDGGPTMALTAIEGNMRVVKHVMEGITQLHKEIEEMKEKAVNEKRL